MAIILGHEIKLIRARHHLDDLQNQIGEWFNGGHHRVTVEQNSNLPDHFSVRVIADPIPLETFAPLIGDILHNLRASLDHLAYALAAKHTQPLPQEFAEKSEFPIFGDKDRKGRPGMGANMFRDNALPTKIRCIHPSAQTAIEKMQPYHRGSSFAEHPLWMLHDLSNIDKHRLLVVTASHSVGAAFIPDDWDNVRLGPMTIKGGLIEGDTEIVSYVARPIDRRREMKMQFHPVLAIAFKGGSVVDGKDAMLVLSEIYDHIVTEVIPPLQPFL